MPEGQLSVAEASKQASPVIQPIPSICLHVVGSDCAYSNTAALRPLFAVGLDC